jgi:hypothetical protein
MAAVTANQITKRRAPDRANYPVAASTRLYEGTLAFVTAAGYLDDDTASGANGFAGIVVEEVDNSSGSAGDKRCEVYNKGQFELVGSSFAQTDVGIDIYAANNWDVSNARAAAKVRIGRCVEFISATKIVVDIEPQVLPAAAITDAGATYDSTEQTTINSIIDALEVRGIIVPT